MSPSQLLAFQKQLLQWFSEYQRPLPWRETYLPYPVWVSEIMLQQTQVSTALPYFKRWMNTLPDIKAVAEASEETILKLWEGLGYYSRARNIQKTATLICEEHGGKFPSDFEKVLALPGIGRYTAGAITSIAFNQNKPIVDGNVVRVVCRLMDFRDNPKSTIMVQTLWRLAEDWIPKGKARFFNQALMELGALICLPQQPTCLFCPVQTYCQALEAGSVDQIPLKVKRHPLKAITTVLAVIQDEKRFLIRKRPSEGLMGGLWEFPNINLKKNEVMEKALLVGIKQQHNLQITIDQTLPMIKHGYTSFKVQLHCFLCLAEKGISQTEGSSTKWVTLEQLQQFSFPAAHTKLIQVLQKKIGDS